MLVRPQPAAAALEQLDSEPQAMLTRIGEHLAKVKDHSSEGDRPERRVADSLDEKGCLAPIIISQSHDD
jgi:hypothetical protein